jgi:hypothetical protein
MKKNLFLATTNSFSRSEHPSKPSFLNLIDSPLTIHEGSDTCSDRDSDHQDPSSPTFSRSRFTALRRAALRRDVDEDVMDEMRRINAKSIAWHKLCSWSQFDSSEHYENDVCGSGTVATVQTPAKPSEWHQSRLPEVIAAASRQIPIQSKTAAGPTVSVISAMSHPRECSWVNFPLQSQQSCAFLKSPAQSIQRSSINSKAYQDLLSMSLQMESLKV